MYQSEQKRTLLLPYRQCLKNYGMTQHPLKYSQGLHLYLQILSCNSEKVPIHPASPRLESFCREGQGVWPELLKGLASVCAPVKRCHPTGFTLMLSPGRSAGRADAQHSSAVHAGVQRAGPAFCCLLHRSGTYQP